METNTPKIENPQQEIQALKERLQDLESRYKESELPKEGDEIKKEALTEHIKQAGESLGESYKISQSTLHSCTSSVGQKASDDDQIRALFDIAQDKGIINAFEVARALKNPHILDAFHDAFIKYQDELLGK